MQHCWSFWNSYSADELVDDLVIRCGLESAVEIVLFALQLKYKPVKGAVTTIIPPNHKQNRCRVGINVDVIIFHSLQRRSGNAV